MSQTPIDFGKRERDVALCGAAQIVELSVEDFDAAMMLSVVFATQAMRMVEIAKARATFRATF